ncbi:MAG: LptF/LptG family permease [Treponema sp.]|jgi:lipopolysaccharide export system permease protein|nr:LptF/LptG family permease [Treponema sp.]
MTGSRRNTIADRSLSKTIFLHIVKETLFAFIVCFLFFFFIFFVNQLLLMAGQILSKRVPLFQVALLVFYALPSIIALAAPFASLSGTLMTIGRLSTDNEILVLLSSGVSYANIIGPALFVGIAISILSFFANDILLPAGTIQFARLYRRIAVSTPGLEFESNSVKRFKNTVIITGPVSGRSINDIIIMDRTNDGERRVIVSKEASLHESDKNRISIDLKNAFVQTGKENERRNYDYAASSSLTYTMSQEDAIQAVYNPGPREMSSVDVRSEIRKKEDTLRADVNKEKWNLAAKALVLENALRTGPGSSGWYRIESLESDFYTNLDAISLMKEDRILSIYWLEFYKKFSIPFGALCFVFLAVTLGLLAKKSGQTVGFLIGIIISVLYWALLLGGQTAGTQLGFSPFWSMWLPNILSLGAGFILVLYRLGR